MTVLNAHFDGKHIVLDEPMPQAVPVNAKVQVIVETANTPEPAELRQLRDGLLGLSGTVKDGPADLARNHDHYLHGTPPR